MSVLLDSKSGNLGAGNDYFFEDLDDLSDLPSVGRYVVGTAGFGRGDSGGESGQFAKLTLLDGLADFNAEVDTLSGLNALIARIRVTTSAAMTGPLRLSFDTSDTPLQDSFGDDIPGFGTLSYAPAPGRAFVIQAAPVPEPARIVRLFLGALIRVLCLRRGRRSCRTSSTERP